MKPIVLKNSKIVKKSDEEIRAIMATRDAEWELRKSDVIAKHFEYANGYENEAARNMFKSSAERESPPEGDE